MSFKDKTAGGLFLTQERVENQIAYVHNLARNQNDPDNAYFFKDKIKQLNDLYLLLIESEKNFYREMNLPSNPKEAMKILQKRIDEINEESGLKNLTGKFAYDILAQLRFYFTTFSSDTIYAILNRPDVQDELIQINQGKAIEKMEDLIDTLNLGLYRKNSKSQYHFVKNKNIGLSRYILDIKAKKGSQYVTFSGDPLPSEMKRKIITSLERIQNQQIGASFSLTKNSSSYQNFYNDLKNILSKKISSKAKPYLDYEFSNNFDSYAVFINESSTKGFLGELRTNIILDMLFESKGVKAIPTGIIKEVESGADISIDTVLNGYGFQTKNYSLIEKGSNKKVQFKGSNQAANFILDRAKVKYPEVLIELFGAYQFNQIFPNDPQKGWPGTYPSTYSKFGQAFQDTNLIFQYYIDEIIKVSNEFQARENSLKLFSDKKLYFNSFFMIENLIVPSSAIIQAIIKAVSKQRQSRELVDFQIKNISKRENANTLHSIISEGHRNLSKSGYNAKSMANLVSLRYQVTLNLTKILTDAYNYIK